MPSVMQRIGTPNARHNIDNAYRAKLENVDPELSKYNEIIRIRSVEKIYQEILQPGFEAFNARQTRKDRRLDLKWNSPTYLEYQRALDKKARESKNKIDKKGKPPIREIVWQFGNPEQGYGSIGQTEESRERTKVMLLECQVLAEERYSQLAWGDLIFHADEVSKDAFDKNHGTLHLHSSFVPLCYKNKQGPDVQVAFERCLHEMGFESFTAWKHDLDSIMEEVLHKYGLERTYMDNHEKHQDSTQWHRQQQEIRRTKEFQKKSDRAEQQLSDIEWAIHVELADFDKRIKSFGAASIEDVLENQDGIYNNILFLAANCDDDRFEELDREGQELREQMLREAVESTQNLVSDRLDQTISILNSERKLTWEERQRQWEIYSQTSREFWKYREDFWRDMKSDINAAYQKRLEYDLIFDKVNDFLCRNRSFIILFIAAIYLLHNVKKRNELTRQINEVKKQQQQLALETSSFARFSRTYRDDLKAGRIPCEKCLNNMTKIVRELDCEYQNFCNQERNMRKNHEQKYLLE